MKAILPLILASSLLCQGEPPRKEPVTKYSQLWTRSLITVPPPPEEKLEEEVTTPLDDYVLGGYTKLKSGYFVSLINTKDRSERLTISSGSPGSGPYTVLQVQSNPEDFTEVKVLVKVGNQEKWIGYDDKFLTLSRPAAPAPAAAPSNQRTNRSSERRNGNNNRSRNNNANNNGNEPRQRRPRVRRVPVPPTN